VLFTAHQNYAKIAFILLENNTVDNSVHQHLVMESNVNQQFLLLKAHDVLFPLEIYVLLCR